MELIDDELLTEAEAVQLDKMSLSWHRRKRVDGGGPPFIKIGSAVRYSRKALLDWFAQRTIEHTAQAPRPRARKSEGKNDAT